MHRAKSLVVRFRTPAASLQLDSPTSSASGSSNNGLPRRSRLLSLESLMSFGLGSNTDGSTISEPTCANQSSKTSSCSQRGVLACSACFLVMYCTERCQKQHWQRHRRSCGHPYMKPDWEPGWIADKRVPTFRSKNAQTCHVWGDMPAMDILRLSSNEGHDAYDMNFKICLAASGDIRTLVQTVNNLPRNYRGKFDVLMNDIDPVVVNRNLVILFAVLGAGPSIDEAAELATHLMYSAVLPPGGASYLQRCIDFVYGFQPTDGDMAYRVALNTRGSARLFSMQSSVSMRQPLEMFQSKLDFHTALKSMRGKYADISNADEHERFLSKLQPAHRVAFGRYRKTGVLAPFAFETNHFTQSNRLLFTSRGDWIPENTSPLSGWAMSAVIESGQRHSLEANDIFGCLFVHVKSQLREFAKRMKDMNIHVHLTQFDAQVLSKGISAGVLPAFRGAYFDRVDVGHMMDRDSAGGLRSSLGDWAGLIDRENRHAAVLMHSRMWHAGRPDASAQAHPRTAEWLMKKCCNVPGLRLDAEHLFNQGLQSPMLYRLIESLDAFYDNETAFHRFLNDEDVNVQSEKIGLRLRQVHSVLPKRLGIPVGTMHQRLPNLSKDEFYHLFTLGGAHLLTRFMEFEADFDSWSDHDNVAIYDY